MTDATRIAPISSHPAFKWGVGVWFALLLGLGLFVMPDSAHQLLAEQAGIDDVLADATTQRAALSGVAALLGLLIGLVLAMRVAAINDAASDDETEADDMDEVWLQEEQEEDLPLATNEDGPRRPFNPREDMDEEGITAIEVSALADSAIDESPAHEPEDAIFEEIEADEVAAAPEDARNEPTSKTDAGFTETRNAPLIGRPDEFEAPETATEATSEALGDMSLDALTTRLGAALDAIKAGTAAESEDSDPVIAFLRREAERDTPRHRDEDENDPQTELRNALEKLNRVGKPK